MLARYREVVETVLRFRESKERLIRRAVISLLPRLAAFAPERFAATYLKQCTNYLLSVLKFPSERGVGEGSCQPPCMLAACFCTCALSVCCVCCEFPSELPTLPGCALFCPVLPCPAPLRPALPLPTPPCPALPCFEGQACPLPCICVTCLQLYCMHLTAAIMGRAGFTALGEMAMALAKVGAQSVMGPLLPRVGDQIKEAISVKGRARPNCPEALQCVGVLAQALGSTWKSEATSLVQPMMSTGLSQPLVKTLQASFQFFHAVVLVYPTTWRQGSTAGCLQGCLAPCMQPVKFTAMPQFLGKKSICMSFLLLSFCVECCFHEAH